MSSSTSSITTLLPLLNPLNFTSSTTTLLLTLALTTTLTYRCMTPPNPTPKTPYPKDTIFISQLAHKLTANTGTTMLVLAWTLHIALAAIIGSSTTTSGSSPAIPAALSTICRNPTHLNAALFTWSPPTTAFITTILVFAPLRLLAYSSLGANFTFELAKPGKLVTGGVYRYVQHPSYTGLFVVMAANAFFVLRLDGVTACVLPEGWLAWEWVHGLIGPVGMCVVMWAGLWVRVRDEEEMMRREFGAEWEAWHARTKRFVPWVF